MSSRVMKKIEARPDVVAGETMHYPSPECRGMGQLPGSSPQCVQRNLPRAHAPSCWSVSRGGAVRTDSVVPSRIGQMLSLRSSPAV